MVNIQGRGITKLLLNETRMNCLAHFDLNKSKAMIDIEKDVHSIFYRQFVRSVKELEKAKLIKIDTKINKGKFLIGKRVNYLLTLRGQDILLGYKRYMILVNHIQKDLKE